MTPFEAFESYVRYRNALDETGYSDRLLEERANELAALLAPKPVHHILTNISSGHTYSFLTEDELFSYLKMSGQYDKWEERFIQSTEPRTHERAH